MATLEKVQNKDGISYRVQIRKKGVNIYKTFYNEDDAKLYIFYKENLIQSMDSFDVKLGDRVTFQQLLEIKKKHLTNTDKRTWNEYDILSKKYSNFFGDDKNLHEITFDDWVSFSTYLLSLEVAKGNQNRKNPMSMRTLRRYMSTASGIISFCQKLGINIDNIPLKVIQQHITPKLRKESHEAAD